MLFLQATGKSLVPSIRSCDSTDLALTAAGGLPGELCKTGRHAQLVLLTVSLAFLVWVMKSQVAGGPKWQPIPRRHRLRWRWILLDVEQ